MIIISIIASGEGYEIYVDELKRIRFKINDTSENNEELNKAFKLSQIVNSIDSLPLNDKERVQYQSDIANIYQIGLLYDMDTALKYSEKLRSEIQRNLVIRKKKVLFLPVILAYLVLIISMFTLLKLNINIDFNYAIIYGSIGGLLSAIHQNNKLEIDYYVQDKLLYFEAFKSVILSNIMAIIGYIIIKSGVILGSNFNTEGSDYLRFLVYIICGYSQTFIPNMLKSFELSNSNIKETK